jgi:cytochrome c oxidase subunit 2
MVVAVVVAVLVLGSLLFHWLSPWWMTPLASNWGSIDNALIITMWICAVAFVALNLFMAWLIWRYRHRPGNRAHYEPENAGLEKRLTFWTGIGIAGMLAPGLIAWNQYVSVPKDAAVVEANGEQWRWSFRLPGKDGVLGTAGTAHITADNAFGIYPKDPYCLDDIVVESSELHLPINKPVKMVLRSRDVLHDFYVPEFRAKMDLVPGIVTYFWLTPTMRGSFDILCAELCGTGHHQMRGTVVVDDAAAYGKWLSEQMTFGQIMAEAAQGRTRLARAETNPATGVTR